MKKDTAHPDLITPASCPGGCDHPPWEHLAFDAGYEAAQHGESRDSCLLVGALQEAWEWGYDYAESAL